MEYEPILPGYKSYLRDESRLEGQADFIAFPRDTNQMAEAVRKAIAMGWSLTIQGARTGIAGGAVPGGHTSKKATLAESASTGSLVLSSEKMALPLGCRFDAEGRPVLRVQAGINLEVLNGFLNRGIPPEDWTSESKKCFEDMARQGRYRFTPNPTESSASLGGIFACNAKGPNSLRFGETSSHTEAITWVNSGGQIWEIPGNRYRFDKDGCSLPDGSRLNVDTSLARGVSPLLQPLPELDLVNFLAGSEGLAGIVTELELRLQPLPEHSWAVVYFFKSGQAALDFAQALSHWRANSPACAFLSSVEYYDSASLDLVRQGAKIVTALGQLPSINEQFQAAIHVEFEGDNAGDIESALLEQLELFSKAGGEEDNTWAAASKGEVDKYRLLRHGVPELINTEVDRIRQKLPRFHKCAADFMVPTEHAAQIAAWENRYHRDMAEAGLRGFVFGHILEGRLHVNLLPESETELDRCRELLNAWASSVSEAGGILTAENGTGKIKRPLVSRFLSAERLEQIRAILDQLDPRGLFGGFSGTAL